MSGIDLVYNGKVPIQEKLKVVILDSFGRDVATKDAESYVNKYIYKLKPSYKIREVVKGSPAYNVGLKKNDIVLSLNGIEAHQLKLSDFFYAFQEKDNKKIKLLVKRKAKTLNFEFRLKQRI